MYLMKSDKRKGKHETKREQKSESNEDTEAEREEGSDVSDCHNDSNYFYDPFAFANHIDVSRKVRAQLRVASSKKTDIELTK